MGYFLQLIFIRDQIRRPLWPPCWHGIFPSTYLHKGSNPPPPLTTVWMGYFLQLIFIRNQIRRPLWPPCWMGYFLQLIFIRDQIRRLLWPLCCHEILPATYLYKKVCFWSKVFSFRSTGLGFLTHGFSFQFIEFSFRHTAHGLAQILL